MASGEKVVTAGSCFAANLIPWLEKAGYAYPRFEFQHPIWGDVETERLGYATFNAGYGNIYTARQLRQLLERCLGDFVPVDDRLRIDGEIVDPFRPGLRYRARSDAEFEHLRRQHFDACLTAFRACDVFIFTFGLTEAWRARTDGAVYPACPGTIAGTFNSEAHEFVNFTVGETVEDFCAFLVGLRKLNPKVRVVLTVSPVPLVATATDQHVVVATTYSKSVLRVAAEELQRGHPDVTYFPAYEIVVGPQAPADFLEADKRNPSSKAIETVMDAFFVACGRSDIGTMAERVADVEPERAAIVSRLVVERECEEAMTDYSAR